VVNLQQLIANLGSGRASMRYDACEELRVAPSIPEDARSALRAATNDPDPGVADAARRALAVHSSIQPNSPHPQNALPQQAGRQRTPYNFIAELSSTHANLTQFALVIALIAAGLVLAYGGAAIFSLPVEVTSLCSLFLLLLAIGPVILWRNWRGFASQGQQQRRAQISSFEWSALGIGLGSLAAFLGYVLVYYLALVAVALFSPGFFGSGTFEPIAGFSGTSLVCASPMFVMIGFFSTRSRSGPAPGVSLARHFRPPVIRAFAIAALLSIPCEFLLLLAAAF
jgi:hypothetical protein